MIHEAHPVDTLLRATVSDPSPSHADVLEARRALDAAIAAETAPSARGPVDRPSALDVLWRRVSAAAAAVVILAAVVALTGLLAPEPVTALGELATVAERREAVVADRGTYLYGNAVEVSARFVPGSDLGLPEREVVFYQLPMERETWQAADGPVFERTMVGEPVFFDREVATAYAAAGFAAKDRIGEVIDSEYPGATSILGQRIWPTDTRALLTAMRFWVSNEGNPISETAAIVELAGELLRDPGADSALRGAVLRALDELGLDIVTADAGRRITVGIQYVDGERQRLELQFDAEANLVAEQLIWVDDVPELDVAAGTVITQAEYTVVRQVTSIDAS